ncbi:hypothetical protein H5410_049988 [Solanum commersonii]|uniref:Uncharacterized protein n=1 Tax=Solanum commersonii TaxID=4109 RepID=A0A9J5WU76_SOLCO|nr:hypothetical protein H5410_049988 [Solanum commersonii]
MPIEKVEIDTLSAFDAHIMTTHEQALIEVTAATSYMPLYNSETPTIWGAEPEETLKNWTCTSSLSPSRQSEEIHTSLIIETLKTIGGLIYHSNPRRQSEDIRHHLPLGPRRQPEASFIILIPVDNQRILDIIYHWDPEDNRRPHLSFKSPKTTGGLIYHSSL